MSRAMARGVRRHAQSAVLAAHELGPFGSAGRAWQLWAASALPRRRGRATGRAPPLPRPRHCLGRASLVRLRARRFHRSTPAVHPGAATREAMTSLAPLEPRRRCCVSPRLPTQRPACAPRRNSAPPACATAKCSAPTAATSRSRWAHSPSSLRPRRARCVPARARRRAAAAAASGTAAAGTGAKAGAKVEAARAVARLGPKRRCSTRSARLHFCR